MRANELITEKFARGKPVVCVDVQPAYASYIDNGYTESVAKFLSETRGPIMMYVNADETGITEDNIQNDVIPFWYEAFENIGKEFDPNRMEWFDKGYGYLRSWMDSGVDRRIIIQTVREMYKQKVYDSRDLFNEDPDKLNEFVRSFTGRMYHDIPVPSIITDDSISVGWAAIDQLKRYNNCYIIGGGRDECLAELAILMNAFNIKYTMINDLIYG